MHPFFLAVPQAANTHTFFKLNPESENTMCSAQPPPPPLLPAFGAAPVAGLGGPSKRPPPRDARRRRDPPPPAQASRGRRDAQPPSRRRGDPKSAAPNATPASPVMNALVAAWLADAAGVPESTPEPAPRRGFFGRKPAENPKPDSKSKPSPSPSDSADGEPMSALYQSLYFAATHSRSPSARALARQMCAQQRAPGCAARAAAAGRADEVPVFLRAGGDPAAQRLLEEVRRLWRDQLAQAAKKAKATRKAPLENALNAVFLILSPLH